MKLIGFLLFVLLVGGALTWYYLASKKTRQLVWNKQSKTFAVIFVLLLLMMFGVAAGLSLVSVKLF